MDNAWRFGDFCEELTENGKRAVLTLKNEVFPVTAKVIAALDGTQVVTRYCELQNEGDAPLSLSRFSLLSGALESMEKSKMTSVTSPSELYEYGYFDSDDWTHEGDFGWHTLTPIRNPLKLI